MDLKSRQCSQQSAMSCLSHASYMNTVVHISCTFHRRCQARRWLAKGSGADHYTAGSSLGSLQTSFCQHSVLTRPCIISRHGHQPPSCPSCFSPLSTPQELASPHAAEAIAGEIKWICWPLTCRQLAKVAPPVRTSTEAHQQRSTPQAGSSAATLPPGDLLCMALLCLPQSVSHVICICLYDQGLPMHATSALVLHIATAVASNSNSSNKQTTALLDVPSTGECACMLSCPCL